DRIIIAYNKYLKDDGIYRIHKRNIFTGVLDMSI
ncbi:unnamed protein product, partial [marine sediment metagenome]